MLVNKQAHQVATPIYLAEYYQCPRLFGVS